MQGVSAGLAGGEPLQAVVRVGDQNQAVGLEWDVELDRTDARVGDVGLGRAAERLAGRAFDRGEVGEFFVACGTNEDGSDSGDDGGVGAAAPLRPRPVIDRSVEPAEPRQGQREY